VRGDVTEAALTALLVALEVPVHGGKGPKDTIKTKQQAVTEVVRLAAPCAEKQLLEMGVAAGEIEKLVALLTTVAKNEEKAKAVLEAARPLVRCDFTEAALTALLVALEVPVHGGEGPKDTIKTKQQAVAEVVRLAAPCAEKQLLAMGVDANETTKLVAALTAVKAQQAKDAFDAAVSLVRGEWTQVALTKLLVALQLPMPGGHATEKVTSKNAAKAITLLAAPCVRKFLLTMGVESKALATGSVGAAEMCSALCLIMNDGLPGEAEFGADLRFREVLVALGTNEAEIAEAQITAGLMRGASHRQQSLSQSPSPGGTRDL
jgi:hypothetical protein